MPAAHAQEDVTLSIRNVIERQALFYDASGSTGVVLIHQSGYDAASWTGIAIQLQEAGVASISLESVSVEDVKSGIDFLRQQGKRRIVLIGASIGGAAAQGAALHKGEVQADLVVLLGTAHGDMSDAVGVDKLFLVTERDFFRARTHSSFKQASEPKELAIYPGSAHGQDMFKEDFVDDLIKRILARVTGLE
ncbi:hypothetical protein [Labrenzia sp. DG1229]|uniref:hypothetical protein n=1 Tax=Labrenzia sp. DG1229 TaxID=681847 RepID=UPI0012EC76B0|nr:hypothetical protein [Labrenzia sp. DG1229]